MFTCLINLETQLVIPTILPYRKDTREALLSEHNVKISLMILQIGKVKHQAKAQLSDENIYKRLYIFIEGRSTDVICDQCLLLPVGTWLLSSSRLRTVQPYITLRQSMFCTWRERSRIPPAQSREITRACFKLKFNIRRLKKSNLNEWFLEPIIILPFDKTMIYWWQDLVPTHIYMWTKMFC